MKLKLTIATALALVSFSGCMGIDEANQHLSSMDASTGKLADSVSDDQQYLKTFSEQMQLMEKHMGTLEDELAADREYLKTTTECMKAMSDTLSALQAMGNDAVHLFLQSMMKPSPEVKPANPDDFLVPLDPKEKK